MSSLTLVLALATSYIYFVEGETLCRDEPTGEIPDSMSGCCGIEAYTESSITHSEDLSPDQYPWITLIEYKKGDKKKLLCSGALISSRYVLTSAHCVVGPVLQAGAPISVRLGEYDTGNDGPDCVERPGGGKDCTTGAVNIPIEKTIAHPDYHSKSPLRRDDIALIQLKEAAPYTDFIRPICLPTTDVTLSPPSPFPLHVAGWGIFSSSQVSPSNTKLDVQLPYQPIEKCQEVYSHPRRNVTLWSGQICAGGDKGKGSCKGNGGAPLMYKNDGTFEAIGITSFGPSPCGQENIPDVFTKVYEYLGWIRSQISSDKGTPSQA